MFNNKYLSRKKEQRTKRDERTQRLTCIWYAIHIYTILIVIQPFNQPSCAISHIKHIHTYVIYVFHEIRIKINLNALENSVDCFCFAVNFFEGEHFWANKMTANMANKCLAIT